MVRMNTPPMVQLHRFAMTIQVNKPNTATSSGFTESVVKRKTLGPGLSPPKDSAAKIRKTAAALPGMPSESTGMRLAPETDEFAASVAATPSGTPSPNPGASLAFFLS